MRKWNKYNKKLVNQASIEIYFSEEIIQNWHNEDKKNAWRPRKYTDLAIKTCLMIKYLFKLPYRQTEGLVRSIVKLLAKEKEIEVPSYSQINRRQSGCLIEDSIRKAQKEKMIIALDSTGLSLYTPGQWHERKHGSRKAKWIKLHAAIDVETNKLVDYKITDSKADDAQTALKMLENGRLSGSEISEILGDGAYDRKAIYRLLYNKKIKPNIRLRHDAIPSETKESALKWRDDQIYKMLKLKLKMADLDKSEVFRLIRMEQNYGKRSLSESFFSRLKAFFGDKLSCRKSQNIQSEIAIKMNLLNQFVDA